MPTYDYECLSCGHTFEAVQSIKDRPLSKCPKCRKKVKRLIGAGGGLLFRGSGFYATDYRSGEYRSKAKAESGGATPCSKDSCPCAEKSGSAKEAKK